MKHEISYDIKTIEIIMLEQNYRRFLNNNNTTNYNNTINYNNIDSNLVLLL